MEEEEEEDEELEEGEKWYVPTATGLDELQARSHASGHLEGASWWLYFSPTRRGSLSHFSSISYIAIASMAHVHFIVCAVSASGSEFKWLRTKHDCG